MRNRSFITESLGIVLIILIINILRSSHAAIELVVTSLLSVTLIALNVIIINQKGRLILNGACIILLLLNPAYIILLPLVYIFSFDIGYWSLTILLIALLIDPSQYLLMIIGVLIVYLAQKNKHISEQRNTLNHVRDTLTEEKMRIQIQQETSALSKQKDIDIAILSERNRISRELHDAIGHSLARSIIQIEALIVVNDNKAIEEQLNQLQRNLRSGMDDIRHTIHHIHHESLDFQTSISELQEEFRPLNIYFGLLTDTVFTYNQKKDILTLIREALINSVKHSNSTQVHIVLQEFPQHNKLLIKDNGTDYNEDTPHPEGMGKTIIRQIAQQYDAPILFYYQNGYIVQMNLPKK